ncbi:MAG: HU family DNA-binding protein [Tannerellaceae bacterium]|jgi:DNA-binding protein HU-beta|nr:HU family DNA-binding protein [Tannerellaceae bacterium]
MKNKELVKEISGRLGWTPDDVSGMISALGVLIGSRLVDDDMVCLDGFGQFEARKKGERVSVNPSNGKRYLVPPKLVPVFKPDATVKTQLKELGSNE